LCTRFPITCQRLFMSSGAISDMDEVCGVPHPHCQYAAVLPKSPLTDCVKRVQEVIARPHNTPAARRSFICPREAGCYCSAFLTTSPSSPLLGAFLEAATEFPIQSRAKNSLPLYKKLSFPFAGSLHSSRSLLSFRPVPRTSQLPPPLTLLAHGTRHLAVHGSAE